MMWQRGLILVTLFHTLSHSYASHEKADMGKLAGIKNFVSLGINISIATTRIKEESRMGKGRPVLPGNSEDACSDELEVELKNKVKEYHGELAGIYIKVPDEYDDENPRWLLKSDKPKDERAMMVSKETEYFVDYDTPCRVWSIQINGSEKITSDKGTNDKCPEYVGKNWQYLDDSTGLGVWEDAKDDALISKHEVSNLRCLLEQPEPCSPTQKILGGCEVPRGTFPWLVSLSKKRKKRRSLKNKCGGVIVTPKYILSAAHCFVDCDRESSTCDCKIRKQKRLKKIWRIVVGKYYYDDSEDPQYQRSQEFKLSKVIPHPRYFKRGKNCKKMNPFRYLAYDYAIIKLEKSMSLFPDKCGRYPAALSLPLTYFNDELIRTLKVDKDLPEDTPLVVAGWGDIWAYKEDDDDDDDYSVCPPEKLNAVKVFPVSDDECGEDYSPSSSQLCAKEKGKDACAGDSGGPLVYLDKKTEEVKVIGLVSFGDTCERRNKRPGKYAKVTKVLRDHSKGKDKYKGKAKYWRKYMKRIIKGNQKSKKEKEIMTERDLDPMIASLFFEK